MQETSVKPLVGSVIAGYGIEHDASFGDFYRFATSWFDAIGHTPDKMIVNRAGKGNWSNFSDANRRLLKRGFEGVTSVSVVEGRSQSSMPMTDWNIELTLSPQRGIATIGVVEEITSLDQMHDVTFQLCISLKPSYGIGFRREMKHGPNLYALGMVYIHADWEYSGLYTPDDDRVSRWISESKDRPYLKGLFRDVYEVNLLNAVHLRKTVGDISFEDWVASDPERGTLSRITDDNWLWRVDKSKCDEIDEILSREGLMYAVAP